MNNISNKNKSIKDRKIWKYVIVFIVPIVCMIIHMFLKKCYPFGDRTILIGDANCQYYAFTDMLINKIKTGGSLFYSWNGGMGFDFYTNFFYYLASPFNLIAILIGLWDLQIGVVTSMIVQTAMCGVTMLYYLTHTKKNCIVGVECQEWLCIVLALSYSMSGYILTYLYNYIWLINLLLAPLVMLGIEKLVNENRIGMYYVTMLVSFICNFYFAWFICILSVIWFIDQNNGGIKEYLIKAQRFILISVVSALSAGVVLVPCYVAVLGRSDIGETLLPDTLSKFGNIADFVQSLFWAHYIDKSTYTVQFYPELGYCGIFVVVMCLAYITNKNILRKEKVKRLSEIVFVILALNCYWGVYAFHGFTIPHFMFGRFEFILILLMIVTAKDSLIAIKDSQNIHSIIWGIVGFCVIIFGIFFNDNTQNLICYMGSILLFLYITTCFVLHDRKSIGKKALFVNIIIIGFVELTSNFFLGNVNTYSYSVESLTSFNSWNKDYEDIYIDNGARKTAYVNTTSYLKYSYTDLFASSINLDLLDLFKSLGLEYQMNAYVYRGTTPLTASLFNVRYVLTDNVPYFGGYDIVSSKEISDQLQKEKKKLSLCESPYNVGFGFMLSEDAKEWDISGNPFDIQNNFSRNVMKVGDIFEYFSIDSVDLTSDTCTMYDVHDLQCSYQKNTQNGRGDIQYSFVVPEDMDMYIYMQDMNSFAADVYIDGKPLVENSTYRHMGEMVHVGYVKSGQVIHIRMNNFAQYMELGTAKLYLCKYNESVMRECMSKMSNNVLEIQNMSDTNIIGNISSADGGMLYTSIPFSKGWTVFVDGKKTDIYPIGGGLCGVELGSGKHKIVFKYRTYGFTAGCVMSVIGIVLYIIIVFKRKRMTSN